MDDNCYYDSAQAYVLAMSCARNAFRWRPSIRKKYNTDWTTHTTSLLLRASGVQYGTDKSF